MRVFDESRIPRQVRFGKVLEVSVLKREGVEPTYTIEFDDGSVETVVGRQVRWSSSCSGSA